MMNITNTVGPYLSAFSPVDAHQPRLMSSLEAYVDQNDEYAISELLDVQENVEWIVKGLKRSSYSLLHQAAEKKKNNALMAMMEKLPLEVWGFRTREHLEHTPPIKGGRTPLMFMAENNNGKMILELRNQLIFRERDGNLQSSAVRKEYKLEYGEIGFNDVWLKLVNALDDEGNTPLLLAVKQGKFASSYYLLTFGANPDVYNYDGEVARRIILDSPDGLVREKLLELTTPRKYCSIL